MNYNVPYKYLLSVRMKTGISKTFSLVFAKKSTVAQYNVIYFVARTLAIQTMPFLGWLLTFSISNTIKRMHYMTFCKRKISEKKKPNTYWPLDVCRINVTNVLAPGHVQLFANNAYLNSSSHTTCSANFTWSLCSGL